jgi:PKD repeat protein
MTAGARSAILVPVRVAAPVLSTGSTLKWEKSVKEEEGMEENKGSADVQEPVGQGQEDTLDGPATASEDASDASAPEAGSEQTERSPTEDEGRSSRRTITALAVALGVVAALLFLLIGITVGRDGGESGAGATPTPLPPAATVLPTAAPTWTPVPTPKPGRPPQAVIAAPGQATVGQAVVFDGSNSTGSTPLVSYAWDLGDGMRIGGVSVSHVYDKAGRYTVTLTVTDQEGQSDSASVRIQVDEPTPTPEPPRAEIRGPSEADAGETVTFDGRGSSSANPIVNYAWDFGDGTQGNGDRVNHIYGSGGAFQVRLTVTDNAGRSDTATTEIVVQKVQQSPPQAVLEGPSQAFVGEQVTFSGAASQPGSSEIVRYTWDFGNGKTQDGRQNAVNVSYDTAGQYTVSLTVIDQNGMSGASTLPILVHAPLERSNWHLTTVLPGTEITAQFTRGQVTGSSGCNNYSGTYTTTEASPISGGLSISALSGGQRLCEEDVMALEARYLEALGLATQYGIQGDTLTITFLGGTLTYADRPVITPFD